MSDAIDGKTIDWEHIPGTITTDGKSVVCGPTDGPYTHRARVPGGWLYKVRTRDHNTSIVFVPLG